jgi:hypothetical protein
LIGIAVSPRAYHAIKATLPAGSVVYPPERNGRGEYLLWLSEAEANRLAALFTKTSLDRARSSFRPLRQHLEFAIGNPGWPQPQTRSALLWAQKNLLVFLPRSGIVTFRHRAGGGARVSAHRPFGRIGSSFCFFIAMSRIGSWGANANGIGAGGMTIVRGCVEPRRLRRAPCILKS